MFIKFDSIEHTLEYKKAMVQVNEILEREFDNNEPNISEKYFSRKKELLKERGIDWKSPKDLNPSVIFD